MCGSEHGPRPPPSLGHVTIRTKWTFKHKYVHNDYNLYKAQLLAQGFAQREHVNYGDTCALVSGLITVYWRMPMNLLNLLSLRT